MQETIFFWKSDNYKCGRKKNLKNRSKYRLMQELMFFNMSQTWSPFQLFLFQIGGVSMMIRSFPFTVYLYEYLLIFDIHSKIIPPTCKVSFTSSIVYFLFRPCISAAPCNNKITIFSSQYFQIIQMTSPDVFCLFVCIGFFFTSFMYHKFLPLFKNSHVGFARENKS